VDIIFELGSRKVDSKAFSPNLKKVPGIEEAFNLRNL
jgi:hypothetical protein